MIAVDEMVKVHRGLLCDVSEKMRRRVEGVDNDEMSAWRKQTYGHDEAPVYLCLDVDGDEPENARGLVLWSHFLYGQSMSVPSSDWPENHNALDEFLALVKVHQHSVAYDHSDGEDASTDAIRDLFYRAQDLDWNETVPTVLYQGSIAMQVLADFVVYGEQGDAHAKLVDANIDPNNQRGALFRLSQEQEPATQEKLLCSASELLQMFIQKGKDKRASVPAPDLMARCRYHTHTAKGQPCYLDK